MQPFIIGTAGHIDHGKSSIVKALTGTNPDRLEEELRRGMTIDLGFAFINEQIAIIDVPGHERFIKNMVAGVSTVDALMLVVAADDSVMPQTVEHLQIAHILGVKRGFVVLNKVDTVTEEWLPLVVDEIRETLKNTFLEEAPIFRCSASTGEGIEEIRKYILLLQEEFSREGVDERELFRLPVDRVFSLRGIGTVVTGSVLSGKLSSGDQVYILPQRIRAKVRNLQSQGKSASQVIHGQRAAINLQGVEKSAIHRGNIVVSHEVLNINRRFTIYLESFPFAPFPIQHNHSIRFHTGTGEYIGRLFLIGRKELPPGETVFAQVVLEEEIAVGFRDRYLIRHYSPSHLLGGGMVLNISELRLRQKDVNWVPFLERLTQEPVKKLIPEFIDRMNRPLEFRYLQRQFTLTEKELNSIIKENPHLSIFPAGKEVFLYSEVVREREKQRLLQILREFHQQNPKLIGMEQALLLSKLGIQEGFFNTLRDELVKEGEIRIEGLFLAMKDFMIEYTEAEKEGLERLKSLISEESFAPETLDFIRRESQKYRGIEPWMIDVLIQSGYWRLILGEVLIPASVLSWAEEKIVAYLKKHGKATVSEIRELLNTTRKNLIPVLNYFDSRRITIRVGDVRVLKDS